MLHNFFKFYDNSLTLVFDDEAVQWVFHSFESFAFLSDSYLISVFREQNHFNKSLKIVLLVRASIFYC